MNYEMQTMQPSANTGVMPVNTSAQSNVTATHTNGPAEPLPSINVSAPQQSKISSFPLQMPQAIPETDQDFSPCLWYIVSWCLFLFAFGINLMTWAIDTYACNNLQASNYYSVSYYVSTYVGATTTDSTQLYTSSLTDVLPTAMGLVYSWLLWKLPLMVFAYHACNRQPSLGMKLLSVSVLTIVMAAIDILGTIFLLSIYNQFIFFGIYAALTVLIAFLNNVGIEEGKSAILNSSIPLFLIALLYVSYSLFLPSLYSVYNKNLDQMSAVFLVIYLYPLFDLLLYSISLFFGSYMYNDIKDFFGSLHYFMLGYGVGMILLVGYTEVEFYYLLSYFIFRNIFVNWIMRKWERVVCNPPCLPGWAIVYYVSYLINFLPLIGVGKLVVSLGFKSPLFAIASPMLYSVPNPLYPSSTYAASIINSTWSGNIFWLAALIIWLGITLSQKYQRRKPIWMDLFYYLIGIKLFYIGICCSLSIPILTTSASLA